MLRNAVLIVLFALLFVVAPVGVYLLSYTETSAVEDQKIKYNLPYPGVLPDNPLYFVKSLRDNVLDIMTRDSLKKARLYLLFSDKKTAMALVLEKKGKEKMAVQTMERGEKEFLRLTSLVKDAKKQGNSPEGEFVLNIKLSNDKHREVIQSLLKGSSSNESVNLNSVMKLNDEIKKQISSL